MEGWRSTATYFAALWQISSPTFEGRGVLPCNMWWVQAPPPFLHALHQKIVALDDIKPYLMSSTPCSDSEEPLAFTHTHTECQIRIQEANHIKWTHGRQGDKEMSRSVAMVAISLLSRSCAWHFPIQRPQGSFPCRHAVCCDVRTERCLLWVRLWEQITRRKTRWLATTTTSGLDSTHLLIAPSHQHTGAEIACLIVWEKQSIPWILTTRALQPCTFWVPPWPKYLIGKQATFWDWLLCTSVWVLQDALCNYFGRTGMHFLSEVSSSWDETRIAASG